MLEGYYAEEPESIDEQLDELLCEYVDGSMDETVREAFEEYLESNPELAAHVRCLCETRKMLCRVGACRHASLGMQAQLRVRLAGELNRRNQSARMMSGRLGNAALLTSAVGLMLILGMMTGLTVIHGSFVEGAQDSIDVADQMAPFLTLPDDAYGSTVPASVPLESISVIESVAGPVTVLPIVSRSGAMTPLARGYSRSDSVRSVRRSGRRIDLP